MPEVKCQLCSTYFHIKPSHQRLGWGKYCSLTCTHAAQRKGQYVACSLCSKVIWRPPRQIARSQSNLFFCTKACQSTWRNSKMQIGKNHPLWQGGTTTYRKRMEETTQVIRCEKCELSDKRVLVVHHKDCNRRNNTLKNLQWLCRNCHYLEHGGKTA